MAEMTDAGFVSNSLWESYKLEFISKYNFKMQLESFIGQLEREMRKAGPQPGRTFRFFYVKTKFHLAEYKRLGCLCAAHFETGKFSPVALFFPGEQAMNGADEYEQCYKVVRRELNWD